MSIINADESWLMYPGQKSDTMLGGLEQIDYSFSFLSHGLRNGPMYTVLEHVCHSQMNVVLLWSTRYIGS